MTPDSNYPLSEAATETARIMRPICVPVSHSNAVECYPCHEVPLNYNGSLLFHGGDTGSTPVRDANSSVCSYSLTKAKIDESGKLNTHTEDTNAS
jgi:hypothetical protein